MAADFSHTSQALDFRLCKKRPNKNDDFVDFREIFKISEHNVYTLRSIIVHHGKANAGHYVAYVRDEHHGWLLYNDSPPETKKVASSTVLKQRPYMLFYERNS